MPNAPDSVLVVDDDAPIGRVLTALLEGRGLEATWVPSAEEALKALDRRPFDLVLSDIRMPGMDGMSLLDQIGARFPGLPVILLTGHGSVALAVDAMKRGAADFVQKPFDKTEIAFVVEKALTASRASRAAAPQPAPARSDVTGILGSSPAMQEVVASIKKVAPTTATVLVLGETGTGKELVARALHETSPRKGEAFVAVHCAALPEQLLESELFGYEKGAFTGATQQKPGRVELAHKGTLFLDEIGDISPGVQVKLLRVLQEKAFERVGGTQTIRVDVRVVAATHRDLEAMVKRGELREDLFYRLDVVRIMVPPLRAREGDVALLVRHFFAAASKSVDRPKLRIADDAVALLSQQHWPGNVRQLQNLAERIAVLADENLVTRADVERELGGGPPAMATTPLPVSPRADGSLDSARKGTEREALVRALAQAANNRTQAARILQVSRRTLYNKLKEHGLE